MTGQSPEAGNNSAVEQNIQQWWGVARDEADELQHTDNHKRNGKRQGEQSPTVRKSSSLLLGQAVEDQVPWKESTKHNDAEYNEIHDFLPLEKTPDRVLSLKDSWLGQWWIKTRFWEADESRIYDCVWISG